MKSDCSLFVDQQSNMPCFDIIAQNILFLVMFNQVWLIINVFCIFLQLNAFHSKVNNSFMVKPLSFIIIIILGLNARKSPMSHLLASRGRAPLLLVASYDMQEATAGQF